jgi:hypothetical protein
MNVKQELELNTAIQQQGRKEASIESNKESLIMNLNRCPVHCYLNSIEILDRQSLPLRSNFNRKGSRIF